MLSNQLKKLPTFNGDPDDDVIQWIQDITDGLNDVKFTDDRKLSIIGGYIDGDARRWLLGNLSALDSWSTFTEEIKNEFATMSSKEDAVSHGNYWMHTLSATMMYDNDIVNEEPKCELLESNEENLNYASTTLLELNHIASLNMCIVENSENDCEFVWPDGSESWFIHDELPQRCQFVQPKQPDVLYNSTSNTDDAFAQENFSTCNDALSSSVMNDTYISSNYNIKAVDHLSQLHAIYNNIILSFPSLSELVSVNNVCRQTFTYNTAGLYTCHNVLFCDTHDREWFRRLAVP